MAERPMSGMQRFFTRFVDAETAAAMEAHSRAWLVECAHCGFTRSIWELGGIRYKATGNPRMLGSCPQCGQRGWHKVHKAADFPETRVPAWPLIRLILSVTVVALIVIAILAGIVLKLVGVV